MSKPRVLWIPHTAWERCAAQRPKRLVDQLKDRFEIHIATWSARDPQSGSPTKFYLNPINHLNALHLQSRTEDGLQVHHLRVALPVAQSLMKHTYPPNAVLLPAQLGFQQSIRSLHKRLKFDAVVAAPSHHMTGYPPKLKGVPFVLDYLDASPPKIVERYVKMSTEIVAVSNHLKDELKANWNADSHMIPNGLFIERLKNANRDRGRKKWGLEGKRVISLIGLTCSPSLYFIDSIGGLMQEFPDIVFLAAGGGLLAGEIERRCKAASVPAVMTGWIDPSEVADLFAASDIGLYPGDDNPYFDGACPLKVLEYTGAHVPMVVNQAKELRRLNFPSLVISPANARDFADGLRQALRNPPTDFPDMTSYDWSNLGRAFGDVIDAAVASGRQGVQH
jgi:glycosyltransferase involved in cell wall biosynthesis